MTRKNLLEAFRRSDDSPGGTPAPGVGTNPPKVPAERAPRARSGAWRSSALPLVLVAVVIAFALGYLAGSRAGAAGADEVRAADAEPATPAGEPARASLPPPTNQPRAFQQPPGPGETGKTAEAPRIEESALFDPANLYTVAVASYGKTHPELAWATYEHLKEAGLDVFPPIESGNMLAIFVGATPTLAELADTEAAIKKLTRDGKKAAYGDAYRARIDKLIPRDTGN